MTSPSPAPRAADLTRQRLVRTALELFTTRGYHDTTTAQIARKAGVAEGTIYRHFASKQHLWNELYRAAVRWAAEIVRDAETSGPEAKAKLTLVAQGLIEGATRDPGVVRLGLLDRPGPGALDDDSKKLTRELQAGLERLVAQGKAAGTVRAGGADVWAGIWLAAVAYALERIVTREWKAGDARVASAIEAAWEAIAV